MKTNLKNTNDFAAINFAANKIQLQGVLNFNTVPTLRNQGLAWLDKQTQAVELDCQGVERCDSAALALLVVFWRAAHCRKIKINFTHFPKQLLDMASLSGLNDILPIDLT